MKESAPQAAGEKPPLRDFVDDAAILLAGFSDPTLSQQIQDKSPRSLTFEQVETLSEAEQSLSQGPVGVLAIGPGLAAVSSKTQEIVSFLETFKSRHPYQGTVKVLLGLEDTAMIRRLVQADLLYFAGSQQPESESVAELLSAAFEHFRRCEILELAAAPGAEDRRAVIARKVLSTADTLLQTTDLEAAGEPVFEALRELIGIERARLWLYDSIAHTLTDTTSAEITMSAVTGVTSYAARAGKPVLATALESDTRHDAEVDGEDAHVLAVPIVGPEEQVLGVLTVGRQKPAFGDEDVAVVERFCSHLAPMMTLYAPRTLETALQLGTQGSDADLFRREAMEAQAKGFSERGRVLYNTKGWTEWTWWLILSGFFAAMLFVLIGRMHDYAAGPAVVRIGQRIEVTAPAGAPVTSVEVEPLQEVVAGQPLVRLFGAPQASQISNLEQEFEQRLRQRLAAPGDPGIEASLIDVRTRLEDAKARLDERTVRSPIDGVVGDVRVRPGQHPEIGEFLMSIIADAEKRTVIGLIPGHFGPQLEVGQRLRLTLQGYPDLALKLRVLSIGDEVIAAQEARQAIGRTIASSIETTGPVVLVEASLPEASFSDGRKSLVFSDGMQGSMEIRVRSRPILFHLIPGLDTALRGLDG